MATKPMKTLKLPGLEDTYTFLQNDTTLTQSGKAADAKTTGDALAAVQAQVDGVQAGQYPDMGAGQLLSTTGTANPTPYTYRENVSGSDRVTISQITGGTVAWNQLDYQREGTAATGQYSAMWSVAASKKPYIYSGHIYLFSFVQPTCAVYRQNFTSLPAGYKVYPAPTVETRQEFLVQASGDGAARLDPIVSKYETTEESYALKDKQIFDLTQMFGATVAQHFIDLETATPGAGVALFRTMFPESYYPYNAGELLSVQTSGRKSGDHTYPLDSTITLRGVPVLSGGVPAYDGDKYAPDGTVTRRYGIVDLGSLTWTRGQIANSENYRFATTVTGIKGSTTNYLISGGLYTQVTATSDLAGADMTSLCGSNGFCLRNDAYSTGADFKTAMSGVYLVYELATPTTETAAPYQEIQIAGSTEEFLPPETDTRAVAVPVGSVSLYQTNLRAGLEKVLETLDGADPAHSEAIAPVQGDTASANISQGELLMHGGKLYAATQAIVAGAAINDTNTTATTVAAQLAALEARIAALENA